MAYSKFSEMVEKCKENPHTKTVAVAGAADEHVLCAIIEAEKNKSCKADFDRKRGGEVKRCSES